MVGSGGGEVEYENNLLVKNSMLKDKNKRASYKVRENGDILNVCKFNYR